MHRSGTMALAVIAALAVVSHGALVREAERAAQDREALLLAEPRAEPDDLLHLGAEPLRDRGAVRLDELRLRLNPEIREQRL